MLGARVGGLAGGEQQLAQAVERVRLAGQVAGLAAQGQGLLQVAGGLPVAALPQVDDPEVGQRVGLADPVADLAEQGQGLPDVAGGLLVAALPQVDLAELGQRAGLAALVADLAAQGQRPCRCRRPAGSGPAAGRRSRGCSAPGPRRSGRRPRGTGPAPAGGGSLACWSRPCRKSTKPRLLQRPGLAGRSPVSRNRARACSKWPAACWYRPCRRSMTPRLFSAFGLGRPVAGAAGRPAGVAVDGDGLGEVPAGVEVAEQRGGQPGGMAGQPCSAACTAAATRFGPFGVQPGQRRRLAGEGRAGEPDGGTRRPAVRSAGNTVSIAVGGGVQVVVEQAGQRGLPLARSPSPAASSRA